MIESLKGSFNSDAALNIARVSINYPIKGLLEWKLLTPVMMFLCFAEHIMEGIEAILIMCLRQQIER